MTDTKSNAPTHRAYIVTKTDDKDTWQEIGALWPTKNGEGFTLKVKNEITLTSATRIIIRTAGAKKGGAA